MCVIEGGKFCQHMTILNVHNFSNVYHILLKSVVSGKMVTMSSSTVHTTPSHRIRRPREVKECCFSIAVNNAYMNVYVLKYVNSCVTERKGHTGTVIVTILGVVHRYI